MDQEHPITETLKSIDAGARPDLGHVFQSVYDELKELAGAQFRGQAAHHTLQPTALVHEAYVRLVERQAVHWRGRSHFKALAARAMKQILVDHHRGKNAQKRGGDWTRLSISSNELAPDDEIDAQNLHEALEELRERDERQANVVDLKFFGGLEERGIADVLGLSRTTVQAEWRHARAWLRSMLKHDES